MNRSSGVLLHVSSLPGEYGCGSLGNNAKEFIDFLRDSGFSYWQVLPFCLPDEFNSPYKSYSAFSLNPFFIDLPQLFEEGLITKEELDAKLAELKKELFNLRFQHAINQLENPHRIEDVKRDIARVMTILHEKNA